MHEAHWFRWNCFLCVIVGVLLALCVVCPLRLQAQGCSTVAANTGDKAVYNSSTCVVNSHVYIDASAFVGSTSTNVCSVLSAALGTIPSGGTGVIDARGLFSGAFSNLSTTCTANPWASATNSATVLLPAGTIQISATWTLPSGTHLIGQGGEDPGTGSATARTTIQWHGTNASQPMIQMGTGSGCTGVSVEDVVLDGRGTTNLAGIDNGWCTDLSYVRHVTLYQIVDIGLNVWNRSDPLGVHSAANSGPYSDITFDTGTATPVTDTVGAYLFYSTHGIHGMTCTTGSTTVTSAGHCIEVAGGSGNSIEDIRIEGFMTGISLTTSNVVVMNVDGDTNPRTSNSTLTVVSVGGSVQNVVLMGISNNCVGSYCSDTSDVTLKDSASAPLTPLTAATDPYIAMYALGSKLSSVSSTSFSRYSTSPSTSTWISGSSSSGLSGTSCTKTINSIVYGIGSLYSNATTGSLYICSVDGTWHSVP